jgi:hypothetical protein
VAELLIKARDASHDDPETDRRGCYKRGDVVTVQDDGHPWGRKEGLPNFIILRIPGAARALAERLADEQDDDDSGTLLQDADGMRGRHRRRRWRIDIDDLPAAVRTALMTTGAAPITRVQIRTRLKRKRDGALFTDL